MYPRLSIQSAQALAASQWWENLSINDVVLWQINQPVMCMPAETFATFVSAVLDQNISVDLLRRHADELRYQAVATINRRPTAQYFVNLLSPYAEIELEEEEEGHQSW